MLYLALLGTILGVLLAIWPDIFLRIAGWRRPMPRWVISLLRLGGILVVLQGIYWAGVPLTSWVPALRHVLLPP